MIYGDDPLKLNNYNYSPSLVAIIQSGNLYVYAMSNPTRYTDPNGEFALGAFLAGCAKAVTAVVGPAVTVGTINGIVTGIAYAFNGKDYDAGLVNGAVSGFVAAIGAGTSPVGAFVGSAIGPIAGQLAEDWFLNKGGFDSYTIQDYAKMAAEGILYDLPSNYWPIAKETADKFGSAARELMGYNESFAELGDILVKFFEIISTALSEGGA